MASKRPWLAAVLPLLFLGVVLSLALSQDPHFWRSPASLFQMAKEAEDRGDAAGALTLAERAWSRQPGHSGAGTLVGWLYLKLNNPEKALAVFGQVLAGDPKATFAVKGRAQALERLGRRAEALEALEGFLKIQPQDREVLLAAAQLSSQKEEDQEKAAGHYRKLYEVAPTREVRRHLVDVLLSLKKFKEAIPLQEEEVAQFPDDVDALHRLALMHYWRRDYEAAAELYQVLAERAGDNAAIRREAAASAEGAGKPEEALKHYLWLYAKHQGKKEYALPLARLWSQKGNHEEAAAVLGPLTRHHADPELKRWYAVELMQAGDYEKARQVYRSLWEAGDTHKETIINLARLFGQGKQFSRAAGMWDEAGRRQIVRAELRWEAALAYSYAQRFGDAVAVLKPVERENPKYPRLQVFLGQLHFYQKHWGLAAHYFKAYLEKHPDDPEVRRLLAEALSFKEETKEEAIGAYGEALKRSDDVGLRLRKIALLLEAERWRQAEREIKDCPLPQDPRLIKELARLCAWAGDLEGALSRYDDYLKANPADKEAILSKARMLIYVGRPAEALELLRGLRVVSPGARADQPENRALLVASIQAALAQKDWTAANDWALRLYSCQFARKVRPARNWAEAWEWHRAARKTAKAGEILDPEVVPASYPSQEEEQGESLTLEERTWVGRALCHASGNDAVRLGTSLMVQNLWEKRHHHPSLLILAYLLPRLPHYEELSRMVYRIPGIRVDGPEYVAALSFFDSGLGRQGGKLDYLLHVLAEYRHHRTPQSPGELLGLADLAMELGDGQAAARYLRRAMAARPHDPRLNQLLLQCQLSQKHWGEALATLQKTGAPPATASERARLYLMRGQYEGVKAAAREIPENHPDYAKTQLLAARACRLQKTYPEALAILDKLAGRLPAPELLMERAQLLEAQDDRAAVGLYDDIMAAAAGTPLARTASARKARALKNWPAAYKAYAEALKQAPQDVELLNELEYARQQMRPQMASRGFPFYRGERRPEEEYRPWQFSRPDREFLGVLPKPQRIPVMQPETLWVQDSNRLYAFLVRASAGFYVKKTLPLWVAVEYRQYHQNTQTFRQPLADLGLTTVYKQTAKDDSRLKRLDLSLGGGPLFLNDFLKLSGELTWRRYWKRDNIHLSQAGVKFFRFPQPALINQNVNIEFTEKDARNRLVGFLQLDAALGPKTGLSLKYSRRDLFDQEPHLYPRLYQGVQNLGDVRFTTYHQVDLSFDHRLRADLTWQGNVAGAFYSDHNQRLTFYQGLKWQALNQPRMQLAFTPHYYMAAYRNTKQAYFSPHAYHALGLGVDFHKQVFRLPTLVFQGSVQGVGQHGDWGPALHALAALEWEPVQNFFLDPHIFFFREWVDNYRLLTVGLSLRYIF